MKAFNKTKRTLNEKLRKFVLKTKLSFVSKTKNKGRKNYNEKMETVQMSSCVMYKFVPANSFFHL